MSLYLTYISKTDLELITVLENPHDYTQDALDVVNEIFVERSIEPDQLREMVLKVNRQRAEDTMQSLDPLNDELVFHESIFLDSAEIKEMYVKALKEHMDRKEGFKFNVWLYALGG